MTKTLVKLFNLPGLLLMALAAIGVQTSFFHLGVIHYLQPDFVLIFIIWAALRRSFWEGGWITLILSDFAELHSAAPQGTFMATYMTIFLGIRWFSRMSVIPNLYSLVTVTLFTSMIWKLLHLGLLYTLGAPTATWKHTLLYLFPGAFAEGLLGMGLYRWLDFYDSVTFKSPRRENPLNLGIEDELLLYEGT